MADKWFTEKLRRSKCLCCCAGLSFAVMDFHTFLSHTTHPLIASIDHFVHLAKKLKALFFSNAANEGAFFDDVFYPVFGFFAKFLVIGGKGV